MWRPLLGTVLGLLALAAPVAAQQRMVIMGDSIQAGWLLTSSTDLAAYRLGAMTNRMVQNFSSPAARVTDLGFFAGMSNDGPAITLLSGFFSFGGDGAAAPPKGGVIIALGMHDWKGGVPLADFVTAYLRLLDYLGEPANFWRVPNVVCLTPIWREDETVPNSQGLTLATYRAWIAGLCGARGRPVIDGALAVPHSRAYYADAIGFPAVNPNAAGHQTMATFLKAQLARTDIGWLPPAP